MIAEFLANFNANLFYLYYSKVFKISEKNTLLMESVRYRLIFSKKTAAVDHGHRHLPLETYMENT